MQTSQIHVQKPRKRHASLMGEYEILHKLVLTLKYRLLKRRITTPDADTSIALNALPSLKESLVLTEMGFDYADVLDQFLGFC